MPKALCTFSGKFGDVIWSLPLARELHRRGCAVDFATMPLYSAVNDLIAAQPYINGAFSISGWEQTSDMCAAQPWMPPSVPEGYDRVLHLTYRMRPTCTLVNWNSRIFNVPLSEPVLPFLDVGKANKRDANCVAYAFGEMHAERKVEFLAKLRQRLPGINFIDVSRLPFVDAPLAIDAASLFLGCRSANYVVAHGVGQRCLTYEPEPGRRGEIFSCPYGTESMPELDDFDAFVRIVKDWTGGGR